MTGRIWLDGEAREVRGATFTIHLRTLPSYRDEPAWPQQPEPMRVHYTLEVDVDEDSGEDGALAPDAPYIPVWKACGGRHPGFDELAHLEVSGISDDWWEAFYGNDAPVLRDNTMRFLGWADSGLRVRWEAVYDDLDHERGGMRVGSVVFEGEAAFDGIYLRVHHPEDAPAFLRDVWSAADVETLVREDLGWQGDRLTVRYRRC